ncbi:MAG: hypothetical protein ABH833_02540 [Parcubacteria group bacterium]
MKESGNLSKLLWGLMWIAAILFWISVVFLDNSIFGISSEHLWKEIVVFGILLFAVCCSRCRGGSCEK